MERYEDLVLLQQSLPAGIDSCLKELEHFSREGNAEVRQLLYDEADVLLECRFCGAFLRSPESFLEHKSTLCQGSHAAVNQGPKAEEGKGKAKAGSKKQKRSEKKRIGKRNEQNLVSTGVTQEMLAFDALPRIWKEAPVIGLDGNFKGSLRSALARDSRSTHTPQKNKFTSAEIKIIENFEKHDVRCGDFELLQCDHPVCGHLQPFHSLQALAYHSSLRHTEPFTADLNGVQYPCLLCGRAMWSLEAVHTHMMCMHPRVKEDHMKERVEDEMTGKRGRKSTDSRRSRSRSLSLATVMKDAIKKESETMDEKEESEKKEDKGDPTLKEVLQKMEKMLMEFCENTGDTPEERKKHSKVGRKTTHKK